jgi:hypothetical protein
MLQAKKETHGDKKIDSALTVFDVHLQQQKFVIKTYFFSPFTILILKIMKTHLTNLIHGVMHIEPVIGYPNYID